MFGRHDSAVSPLRPPLSKPSPKQIHVLQRGAGQRVHRRAHRIFVRRGHDFRGGAIRFSSALFHRQKGLAGHERAHHATKGHLPHLRALPAA